MQQHRHTNRLINESSPYLLQHAHNPVDWYPWGPEALDAARREDKPILLSVGYSACHWCHVMERESFENPEIAALMNQHFINIKVDREERPDVDHIYMNAVQMLTGRGGWPMTVFLRPDAKPFYGGTYFPPEERHGMPAFPRVLEYDETHGGIGQAPKFPNTAPLDLWLRASHASGDARYAEMALHSLRQMARGGMYDQIGGGFHRYSTDARWLVPHFEKMLYDNAQLVPLYLSAYQLTGDVFFAGVARDTLDYVAREMRAPNGGFYSSQDADSEGVEGKFFVWDRAEVVALVGEDRADLVCRYWDISDGGNFEGRNIPHVSLDLDQAARMFDVEAEEVARTLADARAKLYAARETRVHPGRDEKMLTSWNGLMISAFARAAEVFGDDGYAKIATSAVDFVEANLRREDRMLATCKDGEAKLNGYLDDYAFYAMALLDVFEATQQPDYRTSAAALCDSMLRHFWDAEDGGFFFTSDDHEELIVRSKPAFDGSIPSGSSVATQVLLRLYHHTGEVAYLQRAEGALTLFAEPAANQPFGFANLIAAADFYTRGPREIVTVVDPAEADSDPIVRRIRSTYIPNRTLTLVDPDPSAPRPPLLAGKGQIDGQTTVYVCHRMTCSPPATRWAEIEPLLG